MTVTSLVRVALLGLLCTSGSPAAAASAPGSGHQAQAQADPLALAVKHTITKAAGRFQRCYLEYLQQGGSVPEGHLTVDWQITPKGKPVKAELVDSSFAASGVPSKLEPCVVTQVAALDFPPTGKAENHYTFHIFRFKDVHHATAAP